MNNETRTTAMDSTSAKLMEKRLQLFENGAALDAYRALLAYNICSAEDSRVQGRISQQACFDV